MQTGQLTLEEFLILLDAADTQLSNESARVIRSLKRDLEMACMNFYELKEELDGLKNEST